MRIKLETITPVHIGNGESYGYGEAYISNGKLHRCEFDYSKDSTLIHKVRAYMDDPLRTQELLMKNSRELYTAKVRSFIKIKDVYTAIREHIKNGSVPYIPGSSVKGAIRSALYAYYLHTHKFKIKTPAGERDFINIMSKDDFSLNIKKLGSEKEDNNPKYYGQRFEKLVFTYSTNAHVWKDAKYDMMKFVQVSDFNPKDYELYVDTVKTYSKQRYGAKAKPYAIYAETVEGEFEGEIKLTPQIRSTAQKERLLREKLDLFGLRYEDLEDIDKAEQKFMEHLKKAMKFYYGLAMKHDAEKLEFHHPPEVKNSDFKIRVGFGVGTHYQTILLLLSENTIKKILKDMEYWRHGTLKNNLTKHWRQYPAIPYPKSYEVVEYPGKKIPLGWIKVKP